MLSPDVPSCPEVAPHFSGGSWRVGNGPKAPLEFLFTRATAPDVGSGRETHPHQVFPPDLLLVYDRSLLASEDIPTYEVEFSHFEHAKRSFSVLVLMFIPKTIH